MSDCVKELRESNSQMVSLTDELAQKNEELLRHQEEIAQLLAQIVELQHRVKEVSKNCVCFHTKKTLMSTNVKSCFCCTARPGEGGAEDPSAGLQRCSETTHS